MKQLEALKKLEAKISGGEPFAPVDDAAAAAFPPESGGGPCTFHLVSRSHAGSLDAAKALHEAVLPGWEWTFYYDGECCVQDARAFSYAYEKAESDNPARAWLIAIIRALIAMEEVK